MENVFEEVLGSAPETVETPEETSTNSSEIGSEYDLDLSEFEDSENANEEESVESNDTQSLETPTNQAFKQMRVQNKEYATKISELDEIAKQAGLKDVDELIAKSKEAQIKAEAKSKGIPEEVAKELAEFREFKEQYKQDQEALAYKERETALVNNLQGFIAENNLSKEAVNKLSDDIAKDGITNEYLMNLPKRALDRILSSYVGTDVQKNLERKEAIKNELPLNQTSKIDTQGINKQIDDLAKQWAGRI